LQISPCACRGKLGLQIQVLATGVGVDALQAICKRRNFRVQTMKHKQKEE